MAAKAPRTPRKARTGRRPSPNPVKSAKALAALRSAENRARLFLAFCKTRGLSEPVREYKFWPGRRFKFDFAWPRYGVALEVEGGAFSGGRHTRGTGFLRDMEKYSEAAARGWLVVRVTPQQLCTDYTLNLVRRCVWSAETRRLAARPLDVF